jgi:hypothetical protein
LPFGFQAFTRFCQALAEAKEADAPSTLALQSAMLLLPFILGFSTTLVIMILNQFVDAIQSFFGKKSSPAIVQVTGVPNSAPASVPAKTA